MTRLNLNLFFRDVVRITVTFPLFLLWLAVLTGMFSPESLIVFIMALGEIDAAQLAGLMRSAVHIWIALALIFAGLRLFFRSAHHSPTSTTITQKEGSQ